MTGSAALLAAEAAVRTSLHPSVFNHSMRVRSLAQYLAGDEATVDREGLALAAMFHDAGTNPDHDGDQRFEIEGADVAAGFAEEVGWPRERIRPVWEAIVLHTSPGIAERFGPLARMLRTAVLVDLRRIELPVPPSPELDAELSRHPRMDIDRVLPDLVVAQALRGNTTTKAPPFSWPGQLLAEHLSVTGQRDARDSAPPRR